jgi:hypothetical protein
MQLLIRVTWTSSFRCYTYIASLLGTASLNKLRIWRESLPCSSSTTQCFFWLRGTLSLTENEMKASEHRFTIYYFAIINLVSLVALVCRREIMSWKSSDVVQKFQAVTSWNFSFKLFRFLWCVMMRASNGKGINAWRMRTIEKLQLTPLQERSSVLTVRDKSLEHLPADNCITPLI